MTDTKTGTLREAVARDLAPTHWSMLLERHHERLRARADGILSLPTIAAVIADAANWRRVTTGDPTEPEPLAMQAWTLLIRNRELEATVARVRALLAEESEDYPAACPPMWVGDVQAALDGEPQP